jgi:protein-S-isoprenylcysteine O-methyltransferase Ste14
MTIYIWLIDVLWLVFVAYWGIAAIRAKRNVGRPLWSREIGLRLAVIVLVLLALRVPIVRQALRHAQEHVTSSAVSGAIGVMCCVLGIGLAMWARVHLGRNWGMPMSRKQNPELVTTGPYAFVRHPIYTGIILAMFGSMIGESPFLVIAAHSERNLLRLQRKAGGSIHGYAVSGTVSSVHEAYEDAVAILVLSDWNEATRRRGTSRTRAARSSASRAVNILVTRRSRDRRTPSSRPTGNPRFHDHEQLLQIDLLIPV